MKIIRPYEAEDNEINKEMQNLLIAYAEKNNLKIETMSIYKMAVRIDTTNGEHYCMNFTDCSRTTNKNMSNYFYMKKTINNKQKRIPKNEW